jgi:phage tail sheath protein FI
VLDPEGKGWTMSDTTGSYLSPGVYVEELSSGSRPIEGVGTAVAAFVGLAEAGPVVMMLRAVTLACLAVLVVAVVRRRRSSH